VIPVGRGSEGFDVSPDGKEAWVANGQDGTLSVIDIAAKRVVATLEVNVPGSNRLKFTPNGRLVLVTAGSGLVVLDVPTRKEVKRLATVHGSGGIQMEPGGERVYVACGPDGNVTAIDLKTLEAVGHIDVNGPDRLAWAAR
jgi:YVTN family beta-propeller protein